MIDILKLRAWSVLLGIRSIYHFSFLIFLIFIFAFGFVSCFQAIAWIHRMPIEFSAWIISLANLPANDHFWLPAAQWLLSTLESAGSHPLYNDPLARFCENQFGLNLLDALVINLPFRIMPLSLKKAATFLRHFLGANCFVSNFEICKSKLPKKTQREYLLLLNSKHSNYGRVMILEIGEF